MDQSQTPQGQPKGKNLVGHIAGQRLLTDPLLAGPIELDIVDSSPEPELKHQRSSLTGKFGYMKDSFAINKNKNFNSISNYNSNQDGSHKNFETNTNTDQLLKGKFDSNNFNYDSNVYNSLNTQGISSLNSNDPKKKRKLTKLGSDRLSRENFISLTKSGQSNCTKGEEFSINNGSSNINVNTPCDQIVINDSNGNNGFKRFECSFGADRDPDAMMHSLRSTGGFNFGLPKEGYLSSKSRNSRGSCKDSSDPCPIVTLGGIQESPLKSSVINLTEQSPAGSILENTNKILEKNLVHMKRALQEVNMDNNINVRNFSPPANGQTRQIEGYLTPIDSITNPPSLENSTKKITPLQSPRNSTISPLNAGQPKPQKSNSKMGRNLDQSFGFDSPSRKIDIPRGVAGRPGSNCEVSAQNLPGKFREDVVTVTPHCTTTEMAVIEFEYKTKSPEESLSNLELTKQNFTYTNTDMLEDDLNRLSGSWNNADRTRGST